MSSVGRNSVGTIHLRNNAVTSAKVRNGSLLPVDFRGGRLPVGPAGIIGYETVFTTSGSDSSTTRTLTATCPSGKTAIGGGVAVAPASATEVAITASYLASPTTSTVSAQEVNALASNWGLNVVVICATVAP